MHTLIIKTNFALNNYQSFNASHYEKSYFYWIDSNAI